MKRKARAAGVFGSSGETRRRAAAKLWHLAQLARPGSTVAHRVPLWRHRCVSILPGLGSKQVPWRRWTSWSRSAAGTSPKQLTETIVMMSIGTPAKPWPASGPGVLVGLRRVLRRIVRQLRVGHQGPRPRDAVQMASQKRPVGVAPPLPHHHLRVRACRDVGCVPFPRTGVRFRSYCSPGRRGHGVALPSGRRGRCPAGNDLGHGRSCWALFSDGRESKIGEKVDCVVTF